MRLFCGFQTQNLYSQELRRGLTKCPFLSLCFKPFFLKYENDLFNFSVYLHFTLMDTPLKPGTLFIIILYVFIFYVTFSA